MIKKDANRPIPKVLRMPLSAENATRHVIESLVSAIQALPSLVQKDEVQTHQQNCSDSKSGYTNQHSHGSYITLGIVGFLLLQGMMLSSPAQAANAAKSGQRVLMIELTPALCSLQPSRARMRQCLEGYSLTVSGLDMGYGERCGSSSDPRLTPLQLKVVNRIMPDTTVRSQAWQLYGACSPLSANTYFRQIINHADDLNLPNELNTGNTYTVSKSNFIRQMTRLNSGMTPSSIDLICQAGNRRQTILTDVHVCYEGSEFGRCDNVVDNCGKKFIISGGN